jgi:cytidylate kinase
MRQQGELVGKEMRRWELSKHLRQRFQRDERQPRSAPCVLTISRQWGSGGTNIASLVAQELGFQLYDKEILNQVAEQLGANPKQIEHHDERGPDLVGGMILQLLEGKRPTETTYLRALVKVMRQIAKQGCAVIVGRGGSYILPESFRVRIIAPEPVRVARIAELHELDEKTARRRVLETDRQRTNYVRAHFGCDINNPLGYDLVINTEHSSIEHATHLILQGFRDRQEALGVTCKNTTSCSAEV